jgi:hypothetical protein
MTMVLRLSALLAVLALGAVEAQAADEPSKDTPRAAATRKLLDQKVKLQLKDRLLRDVEEKIKEQVRGLTFREERGVNLNAKITLDVQDKTVAEVLDEICTKFDMGYHVISQKNGAYDGSVYLTRNKEERGYVLGPVHTKPRDKPKSEEKPAVKEKPKPEEKPPEKPVEDEAEKEERTAQSKLRAARGLVDDGKTAKAISLCEEIIKNFPKTKAAEQAKELLDKIK